MEKDQDLSLRRSRSLQAVIGNGYLLYGRNFWRLVRSSWVHAVIYALVLGFSMSTFFTHWAESGSLSSHLGVWLLSVAAFAVAMVLFAFAGGIAPLHQHSLTGTISAPRRWWGRWPWQLTARGIVRLPAMLWRTVRSRHAGMLVVVLLVMLLVVLVAMALLQLPAVILATADVQAAADRAIGDMPDMPENLFLFNFATFTVCGLLQAYIHLSTLFPLYYVWGNVLCKNGNGNRDGNGSETR